MRLLSDTDKKIEVLQIELLRQAPPWRRLELVDRLNRSVRDLNLAGLSHRHPGEGQAKLRRRLADQVLGRELSQKIYGPFEP